MEEVGHISTLDNHLFDMPKAYKTQGVSQLVNISKGVGRGGTLVNMSQCPKKMWEEKELAKNNLSSNLAGV